jgi:hypothetical protein
MLYLRYLGGQRIIQIKTNYIPRGLDLLERIFYSNNVPLKPSMKPNPYKVDDYTLVTLVYWEMVKLSNTISQKKKVEYLYLFREFEYVFS